MEIRVGEAPDAATIAEFNAAMALESEDVVLNMEVLTAGCRRRWRIPAGRFTCWPTWMAIRRAS